MVLYTPYWVKKEGELQLKIERITDDFVDFELWHWICPTCGHSNQEIKDQTFMFVCSKCGELMLIFSDGKYKIIEY